ncbi:hypothetical protein SO802_018730 [Lithocarpus litseifolius]|uniref:DUF7705 domain-containing protein n=1 Tax=Lithocarpus litseifolius TaxID=425828 RepID=A0AAW2CNK8_9ROSI
MFYRLVLLPFTLKGYPVKVTVFVIIASGARGEQYISAVGDPRMRRDGLRVAFEAWNFCNEVGEEATGMGSRRAADCFDLPSSFLELRHKVSEADNELGVGKPFPRLSPGATNDVDLYAVEKEEYLGSLCQVDTPSPWQFRMIMLKNGNYDTQSGLCPENGKKVPPSNPGSAGLSGISFYEVVWEKKVGVGSWVFNHKLKISKKYPWLMLYLRADATKGFSGGYHYNTRGMLKTCTGSKGGLAIGHIRGNLE